MVTLIFFPQAPIVKGIVVSRAIVATVTDDRSGRDCPG
jgi:hypothetical protein